MAGYRHFFGPVRPRQQLSGRGKVLGSVDNRCGVPAGCPLLPYPLSLSIYEKPSSHTFTGGGSGPGSGPAATSARLTTPAARIMSRTTPALVPRAATTCRTSTGRAKICSAPRPRMLSMAACTANSAPTSSRRCRSSCCIRARATSRISPPSASAPPALTTWNCLFFKWATSPATSASTSARKCRC